MKNSERIWKGFTVIMIWSRYPYLSLDMCTLYVCVCVCLCVLLFTILKIMLPPNVDWLVVQEITYRGMVILCVNSSDQHTKIELSPKHKHWTHFKYKRWRRGNREQSSSQASLVIVYLPINLVSFGQVLEYVLYSQSVFQFAQGIPS